MPEQHHPLATSWTLYLDGGNFHGITKEEEFFNRMTKLGAFDSIRTFWNYYNSSMKTLSKTSGTFNLRMFRTGVKPIWEDKQNKRGGRWVVRCPSDLDTTLKIWREVAVTAVGSKWTPVDHLCGCVLSCKAAKRRSGGKRTNKIEIWVGSNPRGGNKKIREFKAKIKALCRNKEVHIDYMPHDPNLVEEPSPKASKGSLKVSLKVSSRSANRTPQKLKNLKKRQSSLSEETPSKSSEFSPWFRSIASSAEGLAITVPKRGVSAPPPKSTSSSTSASTMTRVQSFPGVGGGLTAAGSPKVPASLGAASTAPSSPVPVSDASDSESSDNVGSNFLSFPPHSAKRASMPNADHFMFYRQDAFDSPPSSPSRHSFSWGAPMSAPPKAHRRARTMSRGTLDFYQHRGYNSYNSYVPYNGFPVFGSPSSPPQEPRLSGAGALDALHALICRTRENSRA